MTLIKEMDHDSYNSDPNYHMRNPHKLTKSVASNFFPQTWDDLIKYFTIKI